jgi:hypothetical protein
MRKLEFNAWIPELGYMIEDVAIGHGTIGFPSDNEDFANALKAKGFDPEECELPTWLYDTGEDWYQITDPEHFVILQFTGLKDRDGKQIFEGDILENEKSSKSNFFVKFNVGGYDAVYKGNFTLTLYPVLHDFEGAKVIGNIYQNPELIKL